MLPFLFAIVLVFICKLFIPSGQERIVAILAVFSISCVIFRRSLEKNWIRIGRTGSISTLTYGVFLLLMNHFFDCSPHWTWAVGVWFVPIIEEIFFRGMLLNTMFAKQSMVKRVYFNALIFWAFHLPVSLNTWTSALQNSNLPVGIGPFVLGLVCAYVSIKDSGIFAAIMIHTLANYSAQILNTCKKDLSWINFLLQ